MSSLVRKNWLSEEKLLRWLFDARESSSWTRRMVVWLAATGKLSAVEIADVLDISSQTVWLWLRKYNRQGPVSLEIKRRGGRRWAFLSLRQEADILAPFIKKKRSGQKVNVSEIKIAIENTLARKVSVPYVYRLLGRHRWSEIASAGPSIPAYEPPDTFRTISMPWLRKR